MAFKVGDAFVDISSKDDKLKKGLSTSKKLVGRFAKIAVGAFAVAGTAATVFGTKAVGAAMDAQTEMAKLRAVIKATGGAAGFSAREMSDMASSLQNVTTFGDEAIKSSQAILATFKNIKGDQFEAATETLLDMSTVLGQDARQGAIQLGKALNDPIQGVTALRRVGVSFTKTQMAQIKAMQAAGDTMGAQKVILTELRNEFGGAAREAADTLGGRWTQLKNTFADLMEVIGLGIADIFDLKSVFETAAGSVTSFTNKLKEMREAGVFIKWSERIKAVMKSVGAVFTNSPKEWSAALKKIEEERIANTDRRIADLKKEDEANKAVVNDVVAGEKEKQAAIKETTGVIGSAADIWKRFQSAAGGDTGNIPGGAGPNKGRGVKAGILGVQDDFSKAKIVGPNEAQKAAMARGVLDAEVLRELKKISKNTAETAVLN